MRTCRWVRKWRRTWSNRVKTNPKNVDLFTIGDQTPTSPQLHPGLMMLLTKTIAVIQVAPGLHRHARQSCGKCYIFTQKRDALHTCRKHPSRHRRICSRVTF
jgi:hypothetical protein